MNCYILHNTTKNKGKKLILFFTGWGMDERPFLNMAEEEYDIAIISNYSSLSLPCPTLQTFAEQYDEINIVAWSMGVWVACKTIEEHGKLNHCIAINGTPMPISDEYGIPEAIFNGTINTLPQSIDKFNLRMCGSKTVYNLFKAVEPGRTAEDKKEELIALKESFVQCHTLEWTKAVISKNDRIFPPENQLRYWNGHALEQRKKNGAEKSVKECKIVGIDAPHYIFYGENFRLSQLFGDCLPDIPIYR